MNPTMTRLAEEEHPNKAFGWATRDSSGSMTDVGVCTSKATGEKEVAFKVLYYGICHSDLYMAKNEWGMHEIVGEVTEVGTKVQQFNVGDRVGVGCVVGSCYSCDSCKNNIENYCPKSILTYGAEYHDRSITYGGYFDTMVADEHFIFCIPDNLPLNSAAPLLFVGITVYNPLRYYGFDKPVLHIGVVGLGGLGHTRAVRDVPMHAYMVEAPPVTAVAESDHGGHSISGSSGHGFHPRIQFQICNHYGHLAQRCLYRFNRDYGSSAVQTTT
ncbi:putative mannitol dehydrogenase [Gossypium australe]|uniref:Putative mannitol dehydrogenase n=1 Tax=Gossypium australe TaxID=47621 RepID=A0A5B6UW49_9ROSI|nr:putative mannitol dehydrogenase [Gossypium australe]